MRFSDSITDNTRFEEDNAPNKIAVQKLFYAQAALYMRTHGLIISGPTYFKHIYRFFTTVGKGSDTVLNLVEIDEHIVEHLKKQMKAHDEKTSMVSKGRVVLHTGDVTHVPISNRFEDLDLMVTWKNAIDIFEKRLNLQKELPMIKVMLLTVALRCGGGKKASLDAINRLLDKIGAKIKGFDDVEYGYAPKTENLPEVKSMYAYRHKVNVKTMGRMLSLDMITYSDTGNPMMSIMLTYL